MKLLRVYRMETAGQAARPYEIRLPKIRQQRFRGRLRQREAHGPLLSRPGGGRDPVQPPAPARREPPDGPGPPGRQRPSRLPPALQLRPRDAQGPGPLECRRLDQDLVGGHRDALLGEGECGQSEKREGRRHDDREGEDDQQGEGQVREVSLPQARLPGLSQPGGAQQRGPRDGSPHRRHAEAPGAVANERLDTYVQSPGAGHDRDPLLAPRQRPDCMIRLPAEPAQEDVVVKKRRATKKSAPRGRKAAKKTTRTATKKTTRAARKKSARKMKPARASARKTGVRRAKPAARKVARAAVKKRGTSRKAPARRDFVARPVPVTTVAAGAAASASPSGEVYGEEGWREEELSAAELDTNGPELEVRRSRARQTTTRSGNS